MAPKFPAIDADIETVRLGNHTYEVVPQPIALVKHDLADVFDGLTAGEIDASNIGAFFTGGMHTFLKVFIPDLMPVHEWEGYQSAEAMKAGVLDRDVARMLSPQGPQVKLAMRVALKVNGLDGYKSLAALVDPTTRQVITAKALRWLESAISASESSAPALTPSTTSSPQVSPTEADTGDYKGPTEEWIAEEDETRAMMFSAGSSSPPADASASTG